jgi:hypothetical protein
VACRTMLGNRPKRDCWLTVATVWASRSHKAAFWKIGAQAPTERPGQKVLPWLLAYQCQPDVSAFV